MKNRSGTFHRISHINCDVSLDVFEIIFQAISEVHLECSFLHVFGIFGGSSWWSAENWKISICIGTQFMRNNQQLSPSFSLSLSVSFCAVFEKHKLFISGDKTVRTIRNCVQMNNINVIIYFIKMLFVCYVYMYWLYNGIRGTRF